MLFKFQFCVCLRDKNTETDKNDTGCLMSEYSAAQYNILD